MQPTALAANTTTMFSMFSKSSVQQEQEIAEREARLKKDKAELAKKKKLTSAIVEQDEKMQELQKQMEREQNKLAHLSLSDVSNEQLRERLLLFRKGINAMEFFFSDWQATLEGRWVAPSKNTVQGKLEQGNAAFQELLGASVQLLDMLDVSGKEQGRLIQAEVELGVQQRLSQLQEVMCVYFKCAFVCVLHALCCCVQMQRPRKKSRGGDPGYCSCRKQGAQCSANSRCVCVKAGRGCTSQCRCSSRACINAEDARSVVSLAPTIPMGMRANNILPEDDFSD